MVYMRVRVYREGGLQYMQGGEGIYKAERAHI
jgi:hypothetical protein